MRRSYDVAPPRTALLLAAGAGTRLRPLTNDRPKPMIEIAGAPILEHNVRLLVRHGVSDIIINLHHHAEMIREYFGDGSACGARISYSYEPELLGTAGAAKFVEASLSDPFLVLYGDNISTCNLEKLQDFHTAKRSTMTVAVFHREDVSASGAVELDANDSIERFVEKPAPGETDSEWVNAGILVASKQMLNYIVPNQFSDFGKDVFPTLLRAGCNLYGYRMTEHLWWIDSLADYELTQRTASTVLLEQ